MIVVNLDVMLAKRKMSMTELSQRVGITMANLSILKNGKSKAIRLSTLDAVCTALHCQPGELLEWVPVGEETVPVGEGVTAEASRPRTEADTATPRPKRQTAPNAPNPAAEVVPAPAQARKAPARRKPKAQPIYRTVVTHGVRLNLRDRGSRSAAVVGLLTDGTRVELLETEGQWAHIRAGERDGWVLSAYLR